MCERVDQPDELQTALQPLNEEVTRSLVENYRRFLFFVERRVSSKAVAEEILQNAFVKTLEKGGHIQDGEGAVTWFYRLLRNSLIDHYRRSQVETKAQDKIIREIPVEVEINSGLEDAICACINSLLPTIKSDYATLIKKIDLDGVSIADFSRAENLTANNTMVKLHRARQALKKQLERSCGTCATHGCLDCGCKKP